MVELEDTIGDQIADLQELIDGSARRDTAQDKQLKQQVYQSMKATREKVTTTEKEVSTVGTGLGQNFTEH